MEAEEKLPAIIKRSPALAGLISLSPVNPLCERVENISSVAGVLNTTHFETIQIDQIEIRKVTIFLGCLEGLWAD